MLLAALLRRKGPPRERFLTDAGCTLLTLAFAAAIATICILYPDGIASWHAGHLSISLDR